MFHYQYLWEHWHQPLFQPSVHHLLSLQHSSTALTLAQRLTGRDAGNITGIKLCHAQWSHIFTQYYHNYCYLWSSFAYCKTQQYLEWLHLTRRCLKKQQWAELPEVELTQHDSHAKISMYQHLSVVQWLPIPSSCSQPPLFFQRTLHIENHRKKHATGVWFRISIRAVNHCPCTHSQFIYTHTLLYCCRETKVSSLTFALFHYKVL